MGVMKIGKFFSQIQFQFRKKEIYFISRVGNKGRPDITSSTLDFAEKHHFLAQQYQPWLGHL